jgi:DNA-binding CsgD family transcriptional regulator
MSNKITWNEETTATLESLVAGLDVVSQDKVAEIAEEMGGSARSVGAKLRKLGFEVEKASTRASIWTPEREDTLRKVLSEHEGKYTYAELAEVFFAADGITDKQVQGKVLSMEMTHMVKPAPKREANRTYSEAQEAQYVEMANAGASLEEIAEALGVSINSARGKGMSLVREGRLETQPVQAQSTASARKDFLEGIDLAEMTVEQIAEATGRQTRGIRSTLTRRGLSCKDYDGAKRRTTIDSKKAAE